MPLTWENANYEICTTLRWDTLRMHGSRGRRPVVDPALAWSSNLSVKVGGAGTVTAVGRRVRDPGVDHRDLDLVTEGALVMTLI